MKKELDYFEIAGEYGGDQDWLTDPWMKLGGCGACTACDISIFLARYRGIEGLCPFDASKEISKKDYIRFTRIMKPYLRPRWSGIKTLEMYTEGFEEYLSDSGVRDLRFERVSGTLDWRSAALKLADFMDEEEQPVSMLVLNHNNPKMEDYVWQWFILNGYQAGSEKTPWYRRDGKRSVPDEFQVKAVTYGDYQWVPLRELWETGFEETGGLVFLHGAKAKAARRQKKSVWDTLNSPAE
ncbi:MAG: hypothetical protein PUC44_00925 [Eubacteriales bacterium]|nr:hypothetical protein [Eubacteriales bacterium]